MFGFSNDWFYANEVSIDATVKGELSSKTALFDSGTGVDQYPGAGNRQALFGGTHKVNPWLFQKLETSILFLLYKM